MTTTPPNNHDFTLPSVSVDGSKRRVTRSPEGGGESIRERRLHPQGQGKTSPSLPPLSKPVETPAHTPRALAPASLPLPHPTPNHSGEGEVDNGSYKESVLHPKTAVVKGGGRKTSRRSRRRRTHKNTVVMGRDLSVMKFLYQAGMASRDQVQAFLLMREDLWTEARVSGGKVAVTEGLVEPDKKITQYVLQKLVKRGYVQSRILGAGRSHRSGYFLTRKGLAQIEATLEATRSPNSPEWRHYLGVAGLVLEAEKGTQGLFAERLLDADGFPLERDAWEVLADHHIEMGGGIYTTKQDRAAWKDKITEGWSKGYYGDPENALAEAHAYAVLYETPWGEGTKIELSIPDLALIRLDQPPIAVELERTVKDVDTYAKRFSAYAASPYAEVLYFVYKPAVKKKLTLALTDRLTGYTLERETHGGRWNTWVRSVPVRKSDGTVADTEFRVHIVHLDPKKDRLMSEQT